MDPAWSVGRGGALLALRTRRGVLYIVCYYNSDIMVPDSDL